MGSISVITDFSADNTIDCLRKPLAEALDSFTAGTDFDALASPPEVARNPRQLWQAISVITGDKNQPAAERFEAALEIVRANGLDASQVLGHYDFSFRMTLLTEAIYTSQPDVVRGLLENLTPWETSRLINLNLYGQDGTLDVIDTPLYCAGGLRSPAAPEIIEMLIEHGADPKAPSRDRLGFQYPVHNAAGRGNLAAIKALLAMNPEQLDVECGGFIDCGQTPLFWAVRYDHPVAVRHLVEQGADIRHRDAEGETPLRIAAHRGKWHMHREMRQIASSR